MTEKKIKIPYLEIGYKNDIELINKLLRIYDLSKEEILDLQWFTEEEILHMRDKLTGPWLPEVINLLK